MAEQMSDERLRDELEALGTSMFGTSTCVPWR